MITFDNDTGKSILGETLDAIFGRGPSSPFKDGGQVFPTNWKCIQCRHDNANTENFCRCGAPKEWSVSK